MKRIRVYRLGRHRENDIVIPQDSVSRVHAEVVIDTDGKMFITDCLSTSGTYVWLDGHWRSIRQSYVDRSDTLRFGDCEMSAESLMQQCLRLAMETTGGHDHDVEVLDSRGGLIRNPETGEIRARPRAAS